MTGPTYRKIRKGLGLSQHGLAHLLDVDKDTISKRERGVRPITREAELALLCLHLQADVQAMLAPLALYYDQIYDGPECIRPEWVAGAEELLGQVLKPGRDLRTRTEAVEAAIWEINRTPEG